MKIIKTSLVVIPALSALLLSGCTHTIDKKLDWLFHSSINIDEINESTHYTITNKTKEQADIVFYFWYGSSRSKLVNDSLEVIRNTYPDITIEERPISLTELWEFSARFHVALSAFKTISNEDRVEFYDLWNKTAQPTKNVLNLKLYEKNINPKLFWDVFNSEDVKNTLNQYNELALSSGVKALPGLIIKNKYNLNTYSLDHAEDIYVITEHLLSKDD